MHQDRYIVIDGRTVEPGGSSCTQGAARSKSENGLVVWNEQSDRLLNGSRRHQNHVLLSGHVRFLMRRSFLLLAAASLPLGTALAQQTNAPTRVVVQVSEADPARWNLALTNVQNLQDGMGADKVVIEIVAYGPGIGMLKADAVTNARIGELVERGVAVRACENTMRNQKLQRADMHPGVGYVPAGVIEIVKRQQEGWAYLRP